LSISIRPDRPTTLHRPTVAARRTSCVGPLVDSGRVAFPTTCRSGRSTVSLGCLLTGRTVQHVESTLVPPRSARIGSLPTGRTVEYAVVLARSTLVGYGVRTGAGRALRESLGDGSWTGPGWTFLRRASPERRPQAAEQGAPALVGRVRSITAWLAQRARLPSRLVRRGASTSPFGDLVDASVELAPHRGAARLGTTRCLRQSWHP
jgi:hypothetical protein